MKRHQVDKTIAKRNWKERLNYLKNHFSDQEIAKEFEQECEINRFRKKDAYDCGNPGCFACHSDKLGKGKDLKTQKSNISFKEQLKEDQEILLKYLVFGDISMNITHPSYDVCRIMDVSSVQDIVKEYNNYLYFFEYYKVNEDLPVGDWNQQLAFPRDETIRFMEYL